MNFFTTFFAMFKAPEVLISGIIIGIYFSNVSILKFLKRTLIISVMLQTVIFFTTIFNGNIAPSKINFDFFIKNFLPRTLCLYIVSLSIYYAIVFFAKKVAVWKG